MNIKIQVNSPEILKRILGDDDTLEVEIRNALIASLRSSDLMGYISKSAVEEAIVNHLFDIMGSYPKQYKIKDNLIRIIDNAVVNSISSFIQKELLDVAGAAERINDFIERQADVIANTFTSREIQDRINQLADQKIKEKLGLN